MKAWYADAILYSLDVETFRDSNGDGVGDFRGLLDKLDYLAELGVTCLWLLPFYPTPNRDDGYDVSDYYHVDPRLGTMAAFAAVVREADRRGIRILIDLVVNHTSIDHPWFQAARRDRQSAYRDYYIWLDRLPAEERRGGVVFPGEQDANWTYDVEAGAYYWHWFYDHQPDLNTGNPAVREEIRRIIRFWLDLGVAGFRMDAAPFLFKRKGLTGAHPEDPHAFLVELRRYLDLQAENAVFLAEADVSTDELSFFFGRGERMHLLFNFLLNNFFFLALARERADPLRHILELLPDRPPACHWANFVRNHDELNLDRLDPADRDLVFRRFAPDPEMRIYGRGIRRRLPPMLNGDRRHIEMVYSLLFSLPGCPVVRYGEEIGMGDDLALSGRMSVRTPMQWSAGRNAGFSAAPPDRLVRPVVDSGDFGFEAVNVEVQRADRTSLLRFFQRLVSTRKCCPELGSGTLRVLDAGNAHVFAHACDAAGGTVLAVHNLSGRPRSVRLRQPPAAGAGFTELLADGSYPPPDDRHLDFELRGYGFRWLRSVAEERLSR